MKIKLACAQCFEQSLGDDAASIPSSVFFSEIIREDGLYRGKCPRGHDFQIRVQTLPHEMLFEIALNAIEDGYYREAVSSFAASVERFYEFSIRTLAKAYGVDDLVTEAGWDEISAQSERQLGAFIFLSVASFKELPTLLPNRKVKFRNKVIHKGCLPNRQEAIDFGAACYEVIQDGIQKLKHSYRNEVSNALGDHLRKAERHIDWSSPLHTQTTTTALNIVAERETPPFGDILRRRGLFEG
ncbi:hypothetical protein AMST5_01871 [freshwater sediment metagenome]|uniref:Uncharacterized protein n=1 Tax=freshwater sediment metagenome TaxID=556182 RepID=A0AA48RE16_9ZZZZ